MLVVNPQNISLNVLPPTKRISPKDGSILNGWIALFKNIASQMVYVNEIFKRYQNGSEYPYYSFSTAYVVGDRVKNEFGVFECIASNTGVSTTNYTYWNLIISSFIGANERVLYTGKRIVLEYALNRYFGGELMANSFAGFRQPTSYSATGQLPLSDIYISALPIVDVSFGIGDVSQNLGSIGDISLNYGICDDTIVGVASSYMFQINIPVNVFASINSDLPTAEKIVRNFVDKYCLIGVGYNVVTY